MSEKERKLTIGRIVGNALIAFLSIIGFMLMFVQTCYEPGHGRSYPYVIDEIIKFYSILGVFALVLSIIEIIRLVMRMNQKEWKKHNSLALLRIMCVVGGLFVFVFHCGVLKDFEDPTHIADVQIVNNAIMFYILPILMLLTWILFEDEPKLKLPYAFFGGLLVIAYAIVYIVLFNLSAWRDFYNILSNRMWGGSSSEFNIAMLMIVLFGSTAIGVGLYFLRELMVKTWSRLKPVPEIKEEKTGWTCPRCGENHNFGNYCIRCGEAKTATVKETKTVIGEWTCPRCGTTNDTLYCGNCGTKRPNKISH